MQTLLMMGNSSASLAAREESLQQRSTTELQVHQMYAVAALLALRALPTSMLQMMWDYAWAGVPCAHHEVPAGMGSESAPGGQNRHLQAV